MIFKSQEQLEKEELEFKESGAKAWRWKDTVTIQATGAFADMPKGKKYPNTHRLTANCLVEKGYATIV